MAGLIGHVNNSAGITVVPGAPVHILQVIAPANQRLRIREIHIQMVQPTGVAPTNETARIDVCRNSTGGTGTTVTILKGDLSADETLQATARENLTGAPTVTDKVIPEEISPLLGGRFDWTALRESDMLLVKGGTSVSLLVTPDYATTTRLYLGRIVYEE